MVHLHSSTVSPTQSSRPLSSDIQTPTKKKINENKFIKEKTADNNNSIFGEST